MDWEPNPPRGCGRKRQGFYLESGPGSAWGRLNLVTMCTGDLKIGGENILCEIPPRGVQKFAPIDTFRMGEVCFDTAHAPTPNSRQDIYEIVRNGTKPWGLIDHVGSNRYSPVSFIKELHEYGASRRVPEELAKEVAGLMGMGFVAIPMFLPTAASRFCKMARSSQSFQMQQLWRTERPALPIYGLMPATPTPDGGCG